MTFHIADDTLSILFEGSEQLWAIKRQLVVPKAKIERAVWQPVLAIPRAELGLRIGGAAIPGGLFAGRFWGMQGKNFVYLQHTKGFMKEVDVQNVLQLDLRDSSYRRLFFTLDKPDIAEQIIGWWSSNV